MVSACAETRKMKLVSYAQNLLYQFLSLKFVTVLCLAVSVPTSAFFQEKSCSKLTSKCLVFADLLITHFRNRLTTNFIAFGQQLSDVRKYRSTNCDELSQFVLRYFQILALPTRLWQPAGQD